MRKPEVFEYIDYKILDGQPLTCEFDVDYGYPETRWEPGDPGGLYLMTAKVNDSDVTETLSDIQVEQLTQDAGSKFNEEQVGNEQDYADYMADIARDNELMEKYK